MSNPIQTISCGMQTSDVRLILNQLIEYINNFSTQIESGYSAVYAMNGTRLEIPRESGQHPSVIAIDSSGRLSVVDVAYTAEKIIITTTAVFTGQIILKS
ncbi:MAG: hypothetical protein PHR53_00915 [Bacteroidales bacterium]|nr:hypothetical protein [Bacteroidales bacterium]